MDASSVSADDVGATEDASAAGISSGWRFGALEREWCCREVGVDYYCECCFEAFEVV